MQRRVVALLIGAAAVLILVVVLFIRVRAVASPPVVSPADVIAASRAASAAPPTTRPSPLAPPQARRQIGETPDQGAGADQSPAELGSRASAGARARARLRGDGDRDAEGDRGSLPQDLAADTPPEMVEKRRAVSDAYDTGDYETAFRSAQDFLRFQADNEYVQRVAAVSACAIGDESSARMHYEQMNESNQRIVQVRCRRYGINL